MKHSVLPWPVEAHAEFIYVINIQRREPCFADLKKKKKKKKERSTNSVNICLVVTRLLSFFFQIYYGQM